MLTTDTKTAISNAIDDIETAVADLSSAWLALTDPETGGNLVRECLRANSLGILLGKPDTSGGSFTAISACESAIQDLASAWGDVLTAHATARDEAFSARGLNGVNSLNNRLSIEHLRELVLQHMEANQLGYVIGRASRSNGLELTDGQRRHVAMSQSGASDVPRNTSYAAAVVPDPPGIADIATVVTNALNTL